MGCLSRIIWEKWSRYNGTTLYKLLGTITRNTRVCETATFCSGYHQRGTSVVSITDHLVGESTDYRWTPQQMANNAEYICITWRVHDIFWLGHIQMTGNKYCRVLSSTDITRSNISTYCIYRHRNWGSTSIRGWTDDRQQILSSTV